MKGKVDKPPDGHVKLLGFLVSLLEKKPDERLIPVHLRDEQMSSTQENNMSTCVTTVEGE